MAALFRGSTHALELKGDGYTVELEALNAPTGWSAHRIVTGSFPLKQPRADALREVWTDVVGELAGAGLTTEVLLETRGLSQDDHSARLSRHAAEWLPDQGLCVQPQKGPPSLWNWTDFLFRHRSEPHVGQPPFAMRLAGDAEARREAISVMTGTGALQAIFLKTDWEAFAAKTAETIGAGITEPAFQAMPWQAPALTASAVEGATTAELEAWSGGAAAFVRESREDRGLLIVLRDSAPNAEALLKRRVEA